MSVVCLYAAPVGVFVVFVFFVFLFLFLFERFFCCGNGESLVVYLVFVLCRAFAAGT